MAKTHKAATTATTTTSAPVSAPIEAMDATPKAVRTTVAAAQGIIAFTFGTGTARSFALTDLTDEVIREATLHGLRQKVQDAAAISRDPATGRSATFADKEAACVAIIERLLAGHWNAPAGERAESGGMLFRALCELQPTAAPAAIKAKLDSWSKEQIAAVKLNPKVKAILDRIAAERAPKIDTDSLLDTL